MAEEEARANSKPVWELLETWLKSQRGGHVRARSINTPKILGQAGNPGLV